MKLVRNTEAICAWARRHGLNPSKVKDSFVGTRLPDGRVRYDLEELVDYTADGTPVWVPRDIVVPADDPMPSRFVLDVEGEEAS